MARCGYIMLGLDPCLHHIPHTCHLPYISFSYLYTCAHAYRIAGRSNTVGVRSRGRGEPARDPAGGSKRRTSLGAARVPRSRSYQLHQRQAPEHIKTPTLSKINLSPSMFDALSYRSCLKPVDSSTFPCLEIYILLPYQVQD